MIRTRKRMGFWIVSCAWLVLSTVAFGQATSTTTTEKRSFEIISVDGNKVVVRGKNGIREVTVTPDFKLNINGKEIGVADLKPGMKGTALVTTTTTTTPVTVTEVRNAEVMVVSGTSIIVKNAQGYRQFTVQDVNDKNITIMRDGARVEMSQLRKGDKLSATIITRKPPHVMTSQEVHASVEAPAEPAPAPVAAAPAPAPAPAPEPAQAEPAPAHKKLPKTGSNLPLLAWFATLFLATGFSLTVLRRVRHGR
jgi:LPXTG-motif cell wall-anchored protein